MDNCRDDRSGLLRRIQAEDFALYEVVLYLDAVPFFVVWGITLLWVLLP